MLEKEINWLTCLLQVRDLLEKYKITYYIDTGTLLGLAREGKFIPWDGDIDIAILDYEFNVRNVTALSNELFSLGFDVIACERSISLWHDRKSCEINLKSYFTNSRCVTSTMTKMQGGQLFDLIYTIIEGKVLLRKAHCTKKRIKNSIFKLLSILLKKTCSFYLKKKVMWNKRVLVKQIVIPKDIVLPLQKRLFYENSFFTPCNLYGYLECRYGKEWNIPRQEYDYINDDKSLVDNLV